MQFFIRYFLSTVIIKAFYEAIEHLHNLIKSLIFITFDNFIIRDFSDENLKFLSTFFQKFSHFVAVYLDHDTSCKTIFFIAFN